MSSRRRSACARAHHAPTQTSSGSQGRALLPAPNRFQRRIAGCPWRQKTTPPGRSNRRSCATKDDFRRRRRAWRALGQGSGKLIQNSSTQPSPSPVRTKFSAVTSTRRILNTSVRASRRAKLQNSLPRIVDPDESTLLASRGLIEQKLTAAETHFDHQRRRLSRERLEELPPALLLNLLETPTPVGTRHVVLETTPHDSPRPSAAIPSGRCLAFQGETSST